jgi:hypothetical protein
MVWNTEGGFLNWYAGIGGGGGSYNRDSQTTEIITMTFSAFVAGDIAS